MTALSGQSAETVLGIIALKRTSRRAGPLHWTKLLLTFAKPGATNMNMQATNGAIQARKALLAEAKRLGLSAFISAEILKVQDHTGAWRTVTGGRHLGRIRSGFASLKQNSRSQWLTRSTRHPYAY